MSWIIALEKPLQSSVSEAPYHALSVNSLFTRVEPAFSQASCIRSSFSCMSSQNRGGTSRLAVQSATQQGIGFEALVPSAAVPRMPPELPPSSQATPRGNQVRWHERVSGSNSSSNSVRGRPRRFNGGAERVRTADLCVANAALSQLSYGPT